MSIFRPIRERIWRGLFGAGADRLAVGLGPLIMTPIFIARWGIEGYGEWVTAQALASFVALACAGFVLASSTEMAIAYAQEKKLEINIILSTVSVAMMSLAGGCTILATILAFWNIDNSSSTLPYLFSLLSLSTTASLIPVLLFKALSSCGKYGEADFFAAILKIIEICLVIAFLLLFQVTQVDTAYILVGFNVVSAALVFVCMKFYLPWIDLKISLFDRRLLRQLAWPIFSTFAYNVGYNQLLTQGPRLLVGYAFGMTDVAIYNVINMVARMVRVPVEIGVTVFRVELSFAHSAQQFKALKDLYMIATHIAIAITTAGVLSMVVFGDYLITLLSTKTIVMNWWLFVIFLVSIILECISLPSLTYLIAVNKMTRPAVALIAALLISFIVSMYTANVTGFYGIAVAVAASTFVFAAVCMIVTLRSIGMTPAEYLKGLGNFPVRLITAELRRGRDLLGIGKIGK